MKHIVNQLMNDKKAAIANLIQIHEGLYQILDYKSYSYITYDSDLFEVLEFDSLTNGEWGNDILSKSSFYKLEQFSQNWMNYRSNSSFGDDGIFVSLDSKWQKVAEDYLKPLLDNLEIDFKINKIEFKSYKTLNNLQTKPSDEEIVDRAEALYSLLLKNQIISRKYLKP